MEVGVNAFNHRVSHPLESCGVGCWLPQTEAGGARPGRPLVLVWASRACSGKSEIHTHTRSTLLLKCVFQALSLKQDLNLLGWVVFVFFFPAVVPFLRAGERCRSSGAVPGNARGAGSEAGPDTAEEGSSP